jgi:NDP-sugar pyrophosphorylase family protein
MGALTSELPKPMLPVAGRPMLEHIVARLRSAGIREILLVVGYRRESIVEHFGNLPGIAIAVQEVAEGTAAALRQVRSFVDDDPFLLTFGDILTDSSNYSGIVNELARSGAATVAGVRYSDDPWQGAAVYADARGLVTRIVEKPAKGTSTTRWNSAGLYAFTAAIFDELETLERSPRGEYELPSAVERQIARGENVRIFEMTGAWRDVGRPEDIERADADPGA